MTKRQWLIVVAVMIACVGAFAAGYCKGYDNGGSAATSGTGIVFTVPEQVQRLCVYNDEDAAAHETDKEGFLDCWVLTGGQTVVIIKKKR